MTFRKRTKTNKANAITVYTRVKEHSDIFCVESSLLFCNYCDLTVKWRNKSTVDSHCLGKKHLAQKKSMKTTKAKKISKPWRLLYLQLILKEKL